MALYVETRGLEEMVSEAADGTVSVRLLRGTWLAKKGYTRPQRLPLRQELEAAEPEAFADAALLKSCLGEVGSVKGGEAQMSFPGVVVLSYCWCASFFLARRRRPLPAPTRSRSRVGNRALLSFGCSLAQTTHQIPPRRPFF